MFANTREPLKNRQYPGRPKDAAKREGIVSAADRLFLQQGYELTSMDAVAKLADVSKLTIYSHFANKSQLFKEVIQQRCDTQAAPDNFLKYASLPVRQSLLELGGIMAQMVFSSDSLRLIRIIQSEAVHHPEIVGIFYEAGPQRVKAAFADLLREWSRQGKLSVPDPQRATEQFFSLLKGETHIKAMLHLGGPLSEVEMQEHVQAGVSLFLAGYFCIPGGGQA